MKRKFIVAILLMGCIYFLLINSFIFYGQSLSPKVPAEVREKNQRILSAIIQDKNAQFNSKLKSNPSGNEWSVMIKFANETLEFDVSIKSPKSNLQFKATIQQIIEFIDSDSNGLFNSSDQIVGSHSFESIESFSWNNISMGIIQLNITAPLLGFQIKMYISDSFYDYSSMILIPAQIKMDFQFHNFPFLQSDTSLALEIALTGNHHFQKNVNTENEKHGFTNNESAILIEEKDNESNNKPLGVFSWLEFAQIDNINQSVNASFQPESNPNAFLLHLIYPHGQVIQHDPRIGAEGLLLLDEESKSKWWQTYWYLFLIGGIVVLFGLIMSKAEYRAYLLNRILPIESSVHRLTMEDVLENENRIKTLNLIIDQPGIHFKELLRQTEISSSSLVWHLDILETFKIIRKQRVGQFITYFPFLDQNPFNNIDLSLAKSKTTLEILRLIGDNPGIYQNKLAKRMDLSHKTIAYHLQKLGESGLIFSEKKGFQQRYYPKGYVSVEKDDENTIQ